MKTHRFEVLVNCARFGSGNTVQTEDSEEIGIRPTVDEVLL